MRALVIDAKSTLAALLGSPLARYVVYAVFCIAGFLEYTTWDGQDLASTFFACQLVARHAGADVFAYDPVIFSDQPSQLWAQLAADQNFPIAKLHPYVQTPLWAWALQPTCTGLSWPAFKSLFTALGLISVVGMIEIAARAWAPKFLVPWRIALLLLATWFTMPFLYAFALGQTHAEILFLSLLALSLSERDRPIAAGAALAVAASIKITPIFLILYWFARGRWREAAYTLGGFGVLMLAALVAAGPDLTLAFVDTLKRVSDIWLVAFNNQALATLFASPDQVLAGIADFRIEPLPFWIKAFCLAWTVVFTVLAGLLCRNGSPTVRGATALSALAAISIAAPIAWSHYYIFLIPVVMLLVQAGGWGRLACVAAIFLLNIPPLALDPRDPGGATIGVVRSHLYSGLLATAALLILALRARRASETAKPSSDRAKPLGADLHQILGLRRSG